MLLVDGLNTYYGDSHVLRGVGFELPPATSLGLLGFATNSTTIAILSA